MLMRWKVLGLAAVVVAGLCIALLVMVRSSSTSPKATVLPATAAGTSTSAGPGVPSGFTGTIEDSVPVSDAARAAIAKANALSTARNPEHQDPVDRGFSAGKVKP